MQRWLLNVAYDGTNFHGWQWQQTVPSVEGCLKRAVGKVANHSVSMTVCGRTDRGVHAVSQCVHFDSEADRRSDQWLLGINTLLPPSVRVTRVQKVDKDFHARFTATARLYRYCIEVADVHSPALFGRVWQIPHALDVNAMRQSTGPCLGEHDFSAFRGPDCQSKTPMRHLIRWDVDEVAPGFYVISVEANAFLHHMVRLMVAALVQVGMGKQPPAWLHETLLSKTKPKDLVMAPSGGLYFWQARYPDATLGSCSVAPMGGWFSLLETLLARMK